MAKRYLRVTIRRAKNINATTTTKSRTMVYAKASYKNTVYTTKKVDDMGQNPVFKNDGSNVFHFVYENETEYITLELFNRNDHCIGKSKLQLRELAKLVPEQGSEEKTLPVMVASPLSGYHKQAGEILVVAQIKQQEAAGEQGNLTVVLQEGHLQGITSIFGSKTTKISAKLAFKQTAFTSGVLGGMGNKFVWHEENSFTFMIDTFEPDEVLEIKLFNGSAKVGECKVKVSVLVKEEGLRADPWEVVNALTEDLVLNKKTVGSIKVATSFTKPICPRNSSPRHALPPVVCHHLGVPAPGFPVHPHPHRHPGQQAMYPGAAPACPRSMPLQAFTASGSLYASMPVSMIQPPGGLHDLQAVQRPGDTNMSQRPQHAPSAPPAMGTPALYPGGGRGRGAPPGAEKKTYFQDSPEILDFVASFH